MKKYFIKHKWSILIIITLIALIGSVSFVQILDRTKKKRRMNIEYIVVHYTANLGTGADARANARYLQKKERAGTHYCVDDEEIIQCTDENNVAYAVGDNKWFGFIPKPWYKNKILNNNSISYEMCLGGDRNDSLIMDLTAKQIGWQLVNKGLDISRVVRHYDVSGKHCPFFNYNEKWDQAKEDKSFTNFRNLCVYYQSYHLQKKKERQVQQMIDNMKLQNIR